LFLAGVSLHFFILFCKKRRGDKYEVIRLNIEGYREKKQKCHLKEQQKCVGVVLIMLR